MPIATEAYASLQLPHDELHGPDYIYQKKIKSLKRLPVPLTSFEAGFGVVLQRGSREGNDEVAATLEHFLRSDGTGCLIPILLEEGFIERVSAYCLTCKRFARKSGRQWSK
jgi:hypothetical protein